MNNQILKIDGIDLRFQDRLGRIQTITEFSRHFEKGILFWGHPETTNDSMVIMEMDSNYGSHTFRFKFDRMDIDFGHPLIDELVRKWSLIWTWYNQAHFDSDEKLRKYSSMFESIKSRFGEGSEEYEALLDSSPEDIQMYLNSGEVDEFQDVHRDMEWMIEFDERNSFENMRKDKVYFEHDFQVWVDLEHSLPAIREVILSLERAGN